MLSPAIGEGLTWKGYPFNEYKVFKIPTTNKKITYI